MLDNADRQAIAGDLSTENHQIDEVSTINTDCHVESETPLTGTLEEPANPDTAFTPCNAENATGEVVSAAPAATVANDQPNSEALIPTASLPVPRKRPSPEKLMQEVRTGLGIDAPTRPIPTVILSATQEEDLKADVLRMWKQHEKCEQELAPLLYRLCAALHAPGRKGEGFGAWLKGNGIPKATAYRLIGRYAHREGLPLPYKEKAPRPKPRATVRDTGSFQTETTFAGTQESDQAGQDELTHAEFIAQPQCLADVKDILSRYLQGLDDDDRRVQKTELVRWLESDDFQHERA